MEVNFSGFRRTLPDCFGGYQHETFRCRCAERQGQRHGKETMTLHDFRAMASTRLNELGFRADVIEAQLARKEPDTVRLAYNRAEYMEERRQLMQKWANYLDELRSTKQ